MSTPDWQALLEAGIQAVQQQQADRALPILDQALRLAPDDRLVRYWLGNACRLSGDAARAERLFDQLLDENAADVEAAFARAFLLREQGRNRDACAKLVTLAGALPADQVTLLKVVGFLRDSNRFDEAIAVCQLAVEASPQQADIRYKLARLYQATGDFENALDVLRQALAIEPAIGGAWLSLAQLQQFESTEERDFIDLETASHRQAPRETEMCIAFALGKAHDDLGRWPEAWRQFSRGNSIRAADQPWDREKWNRFVTETMETGAASGARAAIPPAGRRPVFIVGMLRSGTTLLEQRLDRHPDISGRGEQNFLAHMAGRFPAITRLSDEQKSAIASELWTHMRLQGPEQGFYIDKNPLNFRFLGLLFEVMPEAKVIHIHRDGRDSCLSCYFQLFQHPDAGFSNKLDDLLDYYRGYRRLMDFWQEQFPGRIHDISYTDLVENSEATLTGGLDFIGASRHEAVMETGGQSRAVRTASAWQARQPLYRRSLARWKNYYGQAPEFFDAIAEIDTGRG